MKRETVLTVFTIRDMAAAFWTAIARVNPDGCFRPTMELALAHSAFETGWWKKMRNNNPGMRRPAPGEDFCEFPCGEELMPAYAEKLRATSPDLVTIKGPSKRYGLVSVDFVPPHPMCRFASFETLEAGVLDHVKMLQRDFSSAWDQLLVFDGTNSDAEVYVHLLFLEGYFTADEKHYRESVVDCLRQVRDQLKESKPMAAPIKYPELEMIPGETNGESMARAALTAVGCSCRVDTDRYIDSVVRLSDRTPGKLPYYLWNGTGDKLPSTCILFALRCMERCGEKHKKVVDQYVAGQASADIQSLSAWRWGTPIEPPKCGDVLFIDDSGYNSHVIVCVSDAVVHADGSWTVSTVEGGQAPDSTGQQAFVRTIVLKNGKRYVGTGTRWIWGWVSAAKLSFPRLAKVDPIPSIPVDIALDEDPTAPGEVIVMPEVTVDMIEPSAPIVKETPVAAPKHGPKIVAAIIAIVVIAFGALAGWCSP
jgi:hypothetical protein